MEKREEGRGKDGRKNNQDSHTGQARNTCKKERVVYSLEEPHTQRGTSPTARNGVSGVSGQDFGQLRRASKGPPWICLCLD